MRNTTAKTLGSAARASASALTLRLIGLLCASAPGQTAGDTMDRGRLTEPERPVDRALWTVAERSDYRATSTSAEALAQLDAVVERSGGLARRLRLGMTTQGREIPMVVIADPPVRTPSEARREGERRLVVLILGNIHAGECDGKEGLGVLMRELAGSPGHPLLRDLIVLIAPNYNADGNDAWGPVENRRPGQDGPAEGCGTRENAQGLDLNRDFVKLAAPETRGLVRVIREWDPGVVVDCHTTNGSHHRYLITHAGVKAPGGNPGVLAFSRGVFFPGVERRYTDATGLPTFLYGNFAREPGIDTGEYTRWMTTGAEARYGTTYTGLRGRLSVLVESYSYAPYRARVLGSLAFCRAVLETAAAERVGIRAMMRAADADRPERAAVRSLQGPLPGRVKALGYREEEREGRIVPTRETRDYEVEVWDRFQPTGEVVVPTAYVIADPSPQVVTNLKDHGIRLERTAAAGAMEVELSRVRKVDASRPYQRRVPLRLEADTQAARVDVPKGALVVRTDQPLGRLAVYLLEATSEDGLATWNFFDPWAKEGAVFPVWRAMQMEIKTQAWEP
jgi:dipeptidyl-peptidase 4